MPEVAPGVSVPAPYRLPLKDSRAESPTVMTFRFDTEGSGFRYLSNQAIRLALPGVDDPWGAIRTFSLSSSPSEPGFISVSCKITDTPFKQALSRLRPGDPALVTGPLGHFLFDVRRPSVFLAGGIGVTPFRGMLRYAADRGISHRISLFYSAREPRELIFRDELDSLARSLPHFSVHYTVTRPNEAVTPWNGRIGRISSDWVVRFTEPASHPRYYVAGLPEMVQETVTALFRDLNVPREDVLFESFRGY